MRPAPLMRQVDSALWISGLGRLLVQDAKSPVDLFCVAQSLHITPHACAAASLPNFQQEDFLQDGATGHADPTLRIHTFLASIGASSADFGAAITNADGRRVIATAMRKFVRVSGPDGRPLPWTADELARLDEAQRADAATAKALLDGDAARLPSIERLSTPDTDSGAVSLLRTTALPHNIGAGGHLDHASLLEWAHDAHVLRNGGVSATPRRGSAADGIFSVAISYLGQGKVGDEIEVVAARNTDTAGTLAIRRLVDGGILGVARVSHLEN